MVRWVLVLGLLVAAAVGSGGIAAAEPLAAGPGIAVAADLPEPPGAQFVPGATNVIAATAASARTS